MKETDEWVQANAGECGDAIVTHQSVKKRQQAVNAVTRRTATAGDESEFLALLFEEQTEYGEIGLRGHPLDTAHLIERGMDFPQIRKLLSKGVGSFRKLRLFGGVFGFTPGAQKAVAGVLDFAGDNLAANGSGTRGIVRCAELRAAQGDAGVGHASDAGLKVAMLGKEVDGHAVLPAKVHRRGTDAGGAEDANGFQVVNRDGQFSGIDGGLPVALFRRQIGRVNRNFDLKRQMITGDVAA